MQTILIIVVIVLVVVVLAIAGAVGMKASKRRKSEHLQDRFGGEYERTVESRGDTREAESELAQRERRRNKLDIQPLQPQDRERYAAAWEQTQAKFMDEPGPATREADLLITQVMRDRGYPMDDFEQRSADISVDHPEVVEDYRSARRIAEANDRGEATTEDLRRALVHYRSLFDQLLADSDTSTTPEGQPDE